MAGRAATASIIPGRCAISVGDPHSALPPGWQWVPLSEIAELGTGHTPSRNHPEYWGGDIPWIGIRDARAHHGGMITDTIQTVTELGLENSSARLLPKNTVCLSRTASVGYVVIMGRPMATSQDFVTWSCGSSIDPRFLMNALLAEGDDIRRFGEGSTHTTIYFPEVKAFHISLPPLSEQQRIVAKIDVLSSKSKGAQGELDCIRQLVSRSKRAILDAAFRGTLTAAWRTAEQQSIEIADEEEVLKKLDSDRRDAWSARAGRSRRTYRTGETPKWFPDFSLPAGWHWVSVDQIVACAQYGTSAKTDSLSSGLPVLRMGNLQNGRIDFSSLKYLPRTHQEFPNLLLQPGDVLFNRTNSPELVGKAAVFPDGVGMASFASYLIRLRPIGYLPNLLAGYINSPIGRSWIRDVVSQQVGQANVNGTKLCQLAVPFMPNTEQQEIARRIDAAFTRIDRLAAEARSTAALLDRLDQAILSKAFRGELVSQEPTDERASAPVERIRAGRTTGAKTTIRGGRAAKTSAGGR